ncbi:MAG: VCBS repeat-containing protein [Verrucomicrobiales bacterium]
MTIGSRVLLMKNDGAAHFTIAAELPVMPVAHSLAAADYDNDGDLDLFVACYGNDADTFGDNLAPLPWHDANNGARNSLFRNELHDGTWAFADVTNECRIGDSNTRFSFAASWEDFDNDGDQDLYVANDFGRNNLYVNEMGRFRDAAADLGAEDLAAGMSAAWGDYNNDGAMDLCVGNMFSGAGNRTTFLNKFMPGAGDGIVQHYQRFARGNSLMKNIGGKFQDVTDEAKTAMGRWSWGTIFGDLNNDGWEDIVGLNGYITGSDPQDL